MKNNLIVKFAAKCRDVDRQYEMNNCWELDNGVYNKFVYNSPNEEDSKEEEKYENSEASHTERSGLDTGQKKGKKSKKPQGADAFLNDSLESSFKESTLKSMEEDQEKLKDHQMLTEEDEDEEDHVRKMKMLLEVEKPADASHLMDLEKQATEYNFVLDTSIVEAT